MKLESGQRLGDYQVVDTLAEGGMSESYRAIDTKSGDQVVLKVPFSHLLGDLAAYGRYERETAIGLKLNHPGIQRTLARGKIDGTPSPFLVLEYVEGESFRHFLDERKPLPVQQATDLALQLGGAISYCHEQGVVHRDLKPENLLITSDGRLKLLDFGIALLQGARRLTWGPLSDAVGTPDYMSPEQIQGERGDVRTDVYALGTMLFEMLTGRMPYTGADSLAVMREHVMSEAPRVRTLRSDVPLTLDAVVAKAIRRDPKQRYESMVALVHDLEHLDEVDVDAYTWEDGREWPGLRPSVGGMPSLGRGIAYSAAVLAALFLIGLLVQFAHHAPVK